MPKGKEIAGRGTRGQNALGTVTPFAERQEDGTWTPIADGRSLFPPDGAVELRGVLASSMRDGDWFAFSAVANDRHRAPTKFKAASVRRLARFLDLPDGETPLTRRRALVETGLEDGAGGEWAVRIAPDELVRVTLSQRADGRWHAKAKDLARLPVRSFDAGAVVPVESEGEGLVLYDVESSAQTGRCVNWSTDADYLRSVSAALAAGARQEAADALEALAARADQAGELSAAGGVDVHVLEEVVRSDAIAQRLRSDAAALNGFLTALGAQPETKEAVRRLAEDRALQEIPRLEAEAAARIKAEWEAETENRLAEVRAAVAELEAGELAELERKRVEALTEISASIEAARAEASKAAEQEAERTASRLRAQHDELQGRVDAATTQITGLEARRADLSSSVAELAASETTLGARLEDLAAEEGRLVRRTRWSVGHPVFSARADAVRLHLKDVWQAAKDLGVLSARGADAVVRFAALTAAREVPVIRGSSAADLVELAAALIAGGRVATLHADPTLVTFDDLWSRPGGTGATAFGAAAAWVADTGRPLVAHVSGADRSAARFWYPALAEAKRRQLVPAALLIAVSLDDAASEEAGALPKDLAILDADGLIEAHAAPFLPQVSASLAEGIKELDLAPPAEDHAADALLISKLGTPSFAAALRLSRFHAAARAACGDERGREWAEEFGRTLCPTDEQTSSTATPVRLSLASNA